MPSIKFDITGDNKQLVASLHQAQEVISKTIVSLTNDGKLIDKTFDDAGKSVKKAGSSIEDTLSKIGKGIGAYFAATQVKDFIGEIMNVRKEFEQLQISFNTLLGSDVKGSKMFEEITQFATTTPMLEKDLASAAQTMLGFNIEAEKVMPLLKQMGDISMGDSQKLQSLSLAFSQAASTGKLMGQDLLQMINAGFNPLAEISRTTGRSMADLKDDMAAGKISIEMLEGAFKSATSEGGKFNGMLNKMADSASGAFSNLEGAMQKFYNEMGTQLEAPIVEGTNTITAAINYAAEHIEELKSAIEVCITTFGSYKAACLTLAAVQNVASVSGAVWTAKLYLQTAAWKALTAAMNINPWIMLATILGGLISTMVAFTKATNSAEEAQKRMAEVTETYNADIEKEQAKIDNLFDRLRKAKEGTQAYKSAKDDIISQYGKYLEGLSNEVASLRDVEAAYKAVTAAAQKAAQARAMQAATESAYQAYGDTFGSSINKLYTALKDKKGETSATAAIKALRKELRETGTVSDKTTKSIQNMFRGSADYGNSAAWLTSMKNATKNLNEEIKTANALFGGNEEVEKTKPTKNNADVNKQVLEERKKQLQATLDALSPEKAIGKEGLKIKKEIQRLDKQITDAYGATSAKAATAADNRAAKEAERIAKEQANNAQRLADAMSKADDAVARAEVDAVLQTRQYKIDAMAESGEKTRLQIELNYDKEKAAIQRGIADTKKANEEAARELWEAQNPNASSNGQTWENTGKTGKSFDLTEQQAKMFEAREAAAKASYEREMATEAQMSQKSMDDYLKVYGDMQEKRAAIKRSYESRMSEASTEGERLTLQKQLEDELSSLNVDELKKRIDWDTIFGDLDGLDKKTLEHVKGQLEEFINTAQDMSPSDIKEMQTALETINKEIDMKNVISAYRSARQEAKDAAKDIVASYKELQIAKLNQIAAQNFADQASAETQSAKKEVDEAKAANDKDKLQKAETKYAKAIEKERQAKEKLAKTNASVKKAEDKVAKANEKSRKTATKQKKTYAELKEGMVKLADQMESLGTTVGGTAGQLLTFGASAIKAFDSISTGVETIKADLISLESAVAILAIIQAAFTLISEAVALLGIGTDSEAEKAAALKAEYEAMSDIWDEMIDKKREYVNISYGDEAKKAYNDINNLLQKEEEMARYNALQRLNVKNSSHSMRYRMWEGSYKYQGKTWKDVVGDINSQLGTNINSMDDFTRLSSEQLQWIKENYVGLWTQMDGDFRQYLEDIIGYGEQAAQLGETLQEAFTGVSFEDFYSSYEDMLTDMDSDNETFAENFGDYLRSAILKSMLANEYKKEIDDLYKAWSDATESGDELTKEEAAQLQQRQAELTEKILKRRNELIEQYGLGSSDMSDVLGFDLDSFKSDFQSLISELTSSTNDFADTFATYMKNALVSSMIESKYSEQLKELYKSIGEDAKNGVLDEQAIDYYKEAYMKMAEAAQKEAEAIDRITASTKSLLQSSVSELQSSLTSIFSDMDKKSSDFARSFNDYMRTALNNTIANQFAEQIRALYEEIDHAVNTHNGILDEQSIRDLEQSYTVLAKQMQDAARQYSELLDSVTSNFDTTFDTMKSDFISLFSDMDKTTADFAKKFQSYMTKAFANAIWKNGDYATLMGDLIDDIQASMERNGGMLTEEEILSYQQMYEEYVKTAQDQMEALQKIFGGDFLKNSFAKFKSSYVGLISDLDKTNADFAESFGSYLRDAMIENVMSDVLSDKLRAFYDKVNEYAKDGLTADEVDKLRQEYSALAEEGQSAVESIKAIIGDTEKLLSFDKDSMFSDYKSLIADMDATNKTFADKFGEYIKTALLDSYLKSAGMEDIISGIYKRIEEAIANGTLESEWDSIQSAWDDACESGNALYEAIENLTKSTENYAEVTLSQLKSDFKSLISSANTDVEDFSNKVREYIYDALLNKVIAEKFKEQFSTIFDSMLDYLETGSEESLNNAVTLAETIGSAMSDISGKLKESLGLDNVSSDMQSFLDSFESMVSEMDNTSKDFADNMGEYIRNALIKSLIANTYAKRIQELYALFEQYNNEGTLQDHVEELKKAEQSLANEIRKDVNNINTLTGYVSSSQSASSAFQGMSEDTGEELNGRFTALQISNERIADSITATLAHIESMTKATCEGNAYLQDILYQQTLANGFLDNILRCNKNIYSDFGAKIDRLINKL